MATKAMSQAQTGPETGQPDLQELPTEDQQKTHLLIEPPLLSQHTSKWCSACVHACIGQVPA